MTAKKLFTCLFILIGFNAYAQTDVQIIEPTNTDSIFVYDSDCRCEVHLPVLTDTTLLKNRIEIATDGYNEFGRLYSNTKSLYHKERMAFWKRQLEEFEKQLAEQKKAYENEQN